MTDEAVTNGNDWGWTPKREAVAYALSQGKSYRDVAKECDVGVTTITRWVKVPEFQARIDELHDQVVAEARRYLRRNALLAAQKLVQMAEYGTSQHMAKLTAAKDILDRVGLKAPEKHEHSGANNQSLGPTIQIVAPTTAFAL